MFYEEKLIDGVLYCRTDPKGGWRQLRNRRSYIVCSLSAMSPEQRLEVFQYFCMYCGEILSKNERCDCMRDTVIED